MKIACVDKTAAERSKLEAYLDDAFTAHRSIVGHLPQAVLSPFSLEELLYSKRPNLVVIGPGLPVEEAFSACRHLREVFANIPLVLLFSRENYSLRVLRRFERFSKALFSWEEPSARLIHTLLETRGEAGRGPRGKLITVSGVKGGIGVSSYVAGLAHAAQAIPRAPLFPQSQADESDSSGVRTLVIDLSASAALLQYMGCHKSSSPEYSTILSDRLGPQKELIERMIFRAANGISLLLPPSGEREIRELWLRDLERFEISLQIVESLLESYDLVLVDLAGAEGILPFALASQADARVLMTSNAPASVHLLQQRLIEEQSIPGDAEVLVGITLLSPSGLTEADIRDFIVKDTPLLGQKELRSLPCLTFDRKAQHWMGTGNSLYTEGGKGLQSLLRAHVHMLAGGALESKRAFAERRSPRRGELLSLLRKALKRFSLAQRKKDASPRDEPSLMRPQKRLTAGPQAIIPEHFESAASHDVSIPQASEPIPQASMPALEEARGSGSLEYALFLAGAVMMAALSLPDFFRSLGLYVSHFSDGG